jgi:4-carboxymuconolactone decarboxylase
MTGADDRDSAQAVRDRYRAMFGEVPTGIEQRLRVAQSTGRLPAVEVIEELRQALPPTTPWVLG